MDFRFSSSIRAWAINRRGKNEDPSIYVTYSTEQENKVRKIFIISLLYLTGSGKISIDAERFLISDAVAKRVNLKSLLSDSLVIGTL